MFSAFCDYLKKKYPHGTLYTLRGWLLVSICVFLLWNTAQNHYDITATGISLSLIIVVLSVSILALYNFSKLRQKIQITEIIIKDRVFSKTKTSIQVNFSKYIPLFLFHLNAKINFKDTTYSFPNIKLQEERSSKQLIYKNEITFPHRGLWQIDNITVTLEDFFGLIKFKHTIDSSEFNASSSFSIMPIESSIDTPLPIITAKFREGDATFSDFERSGDPYDLKTYHPTDGIKKIVWKMFAKTGELISRENEKSFTPEGEVLVFLNLGQYDDESFSIALNYLKDLKQAGLSFKCYYTGFTNKSNSESSFSELETLIENNLRDIWSISNKSDTEIKEILINDIHKILTDIQDKKFTKVVVFTEPTQNAEFTETIGKSFAQAGIVPYFFMLDKKLSYNDSQFSNSKITTFEKYGRLINNLIIANNQEFKETYKKSTKTSDKDKIKKQNVYNFCFNNGWNIEERFY